MIEVNILISKNEVYHEVAEVTSYVGAKDLAKGQANAYELIFSTDDDRQLLERYWVEACSAMTDTLKPFLTSVVNQPQPHGVDLSVNYDATLSLSSSYNEQLTDSVRSSMMSFFVSYIVASWMRYVKEGDVEKYAEDSAAALSDVLKKLYWKKKPTRTFINKQ